MEQHTHAEDGTVVLIDEAVAEVEATEVVAEASVEVARIEAERDIAIAKEGTKQNAQSLQEELLELRGMVEGLQASLSALAPPEPEPEPAPAPVVVEAPVVDPEPDVPEPPVAERQPRPRKSNGLSWF
jgi:hypothetical protein